MRIISGSLSGRIIASPHTNRTHPMSDRMRGGLFNVLGDIAGLSVLDAFAGSGAIGLEAASRGASPVVCIDDDKAAQRTIGANIAGLRLGRTVRLIRATVSGWISTSPPDMVFDIIICDPPYHDLQLPAIRRLSGRVTAGGLLVLSWPGREAIPDFDGFEHVVHKSYGDGQLLFYKRVRAVQA